MLGKIRKLSNNLITKIFLGILILVFASFGLSGLRTSKDSIVSIDGKSAVSLNEFLRVRKNMANSLARAYPDIDLKSLNINQLALNELVKSKLLYLEMEKLGIMISDDVVVEYIRSNKMFYNKAGEFDKDLFKRILASNNIREEDYIKDLKISIGATFLIRHMEDFPVPDLVVNQFYNYDHQERNIDLFVIDKINSEKIAVSDKEVEVFYDINKAKFYEPEFRELEYIVISPKAVRGVTVTQGELEKEVKAMNLTSEKQKAELRQRMVTSKIEQQMFQSIKEIEEALEEGKSLKDVSIKFGLSHIKLPLIDANGFDSNGVRLKSMPNSAKFLSEAFTLDQGVATEAIQGDNGQEYYIINTVSLKPMAVKPLEQVKQKIVLELRADKSRAENRKLASDIKQGIIENKEYKKDKVTVKPITLVRPGSEKNIAGIYVSNVVDIFNIKQIGQYSDIFQMADGRFAFIKLKQINNPKPVSKVNSNLGPISGFIDNVVSQSFVEYLHGEYKVKAYPENIPKNE